MTPATLALAPIDDDPDSDTPSLALDAHALYTRDALHHRLLSADEERALARRYRETHDLAARDALITHNLRLVASIAAHYHTTHLSTLDLVQEGTIGLMHAIERFDERKGNKLGTYATWWIRQAIGRAIIDKEATIPTPTHVHETRARLRAQATRLTMGMGREPTTAEVRLAAGVTSAGMVACLAAADQTRSVASLETPISATMRGVSGEQTIGDLIPDPVAADGDATMERLAAAERRADLWRLCRQVLTPRQAQVIALRYGLGDADDAHGERITDKVWASVPMGKLSHLGVHMSVAGTSRTMEEVGHLLGISRGRVQQIEARALTTLRERLTPPAAGSDSGSVTPAGEEKPAPAPPPAVLPMREAREANESRWRVWALLNANPNATVRDVAVAAGGDAISLRAAGALIRAWRAERDAAAASAERTTAQAQAGAA